MKPTILLAGVKIAARKSTKFQPLCHPTLVKSYFKLRAHLQHHWQFPRRMIVIVLRTGNSPCLICSALDCGLNVAETITVDKYGTGNFTTVQGAIDSVPSNNNRWIHIYVKSGFYIEQVNIGQDKSCIFLEGVTNRKTVIQYDAHEATNSSISFSLLAENFVAKNIGFKNTYNLGGGGSNRKPAVAAFICGDKASFYSCGFFGLQDTLWDEHGRHYFKQCYIEGAVDFIFGAGQSIYEECVVNVTADVLYQSDGPVGFITAQRRTSPDDPSGFVFKQAAVVGKGLTNLGRAYGPYSRVIFVRSMLSEVVVPKGWDAWNYVGHEYDHFTLSNFTLSWIKHGFNSWENLVYAEALCYGSGSNTSERVSWEKKLSGSQVRDLTQLSFIDQEGWIEKQPRN
ncbi:hypothetical protein NE237_001275 [Protea cynaroides]|uniref:Pectinesterase n=1 Tax=Protea cynaroides TaxID=273540 RepID=A0A9Q0QY95_9MAGN|nr:hypothetical protein NE237_001275 [Protea cynaroides]